MNLSKQYIISIAAACLFATLTVGSKAQQSSVKLDNLLVTDHLTGEPEITKLAVKLDVTGIDNLIMLQIDASETADYKDVQTYSLNIVHKEGKHYIMYGKDNLLPISGKPEVIFFLDVRDQLKAPYHYIRITGTDNKGLKSNTVQYNKQ